MFRGTVEKHPYLASSVNLTNLDPSPSPEYLLFIEILRYQRCGQQNVNTKVNISRNSIKNIGVSKIVRYGNSKRRKRGVMENIVSAYSDIVTKG